MATKTTRKAAPKKTAPKAAPVEVEVDEVEEDEVETKATVSEVTFGAADLAALLEEKTGNKVSTRELRTLLRKMARDGRINREIIPGNRARYDWSGPDHPEVVAVIEAFTAGELEADKQEKLAALKERKAQQQAAKRAAAEAEEDDEEVEEEAPAKPARKRTSKTRKAAKPAPVEVEDDEELELDDEE
jgi:DNA-binding HxlR family transcriptional regulator